MTRPRITLYQRNALTDCRKAGRLVRRRDGWATSPTAYGAHGFQTVFSLVERDLLVHIGDKLPKLHGKRQIAVELTPLGREALGK